LPQTKKAFVAAAAAAVRVWGALQGAALLVAGLLQALCSCNRSCNRLVLAYITAALLLLGVVCPAGGGSAGGGFAAESRCSGSLQGFAEILLRRVPFHQLEAQVSLLYDGLMVFDVRDFFSYVVYFIEGSEAQVSSGVVRRVAVS
jgi:hypothetical protein